jgi:hypothetical protein
VSGGSAGAFGCPAWACGTTAAATAAVFWSTLTWWSAIWAWIRSPNARDSPTTCPMKPPISAPSIAVA